MWGSTECTTYIQEEYQRSVDKEGSRKIIWRNKAENFSKYIEQTICTSKKRNECKVG